MALFRQGPQQQERRVQGGMKNRDFRPISRFISVIMQVSSYYGRQIWNRVHASNGAIFNDFQWSLAHISRSRYHLTSNNSKMVQDRTDSFTIMALYKFTYLLTYLCLQRQTNSKSYYDLSKGAIFSDLERPLPPISRSHHYLMLNISKKRYEIQT